LPKPHLNANLAVALPQHWLGGYFYSVLSVFLSDVSKGASHGYDPDRATLFRKDSFVVAHDGNVEQFLEFAWLFGSGPGPAFQASKIIPQAGASVIE
jgi:hypothetical protein